MDNNIRDPKTADKIAHDILMTSAKIDRLFYVPPIYIGESRNEHWLKRKLSWYRFKLYLWCNRKWNI